jgi:hypothetical protein
LGIRVTGRQRETSGSGLAAARARGGARVLVHPVDPVIDNPDIAGAGGVERNTRGRLVGRIDRPVSLGGAAQRVLEHLVGRRVVDDP